MQALEQRAAEAEAEAATAEARKVGARVHTEGVKEGVSAMWARLGCAELGLEELLGSEGVTDTNLMQYLGVIEQRANQMLLVYLPHDLRTKLRFAHCLAMSCSAGLSQLGHSHILKITLHLCSLHSGRMLESTLPALQRLSWARAG